MDLFTFLESKKTPVGLTDLIVSLADACKLIAGELREAVDSEHVGTVNKSGEEQIAMDVRADAIVGEHMRACQYVAVLGGEEMADAEVVNPEGDYAVFCDPLDGSSLADVNFSVGTIAGIFEGKEVLGKTGRSLAAALYAVYGPKTTLVVTVKKGVHEFMLVGGEWALIKEDFQVGEAKYFACGNLRACPERPDYLELVNKYIMNKYTLRYSGGMTPDINHILHKGGGIFLYPGTPSQPDGKLRLLFECAPMSLIMEEAGGASSNGLKPVLDVEIKNYEQRTPIFIGGKSEVVYALSITTPKHDR
ncbi:fructose-1,6-bisphosphatase [Candidatus Peregrinibacteria bacterium]|nr:fructose-1,6-bisphosphatase [Candidatus Peregrinibacteria bacterium]